MPTPRGTSTKLMTWSSNTSYLMNISTVEKWKLIHRHTEYYFLRISQREVIVISETMTRRKVQPATNVAIRDI